MDPVTPEDEPVDVCAGQLDDLSAFAKELKLDVEVLAFMLELPADLRSAIMLNFDPSGTKDGNVLGRLQAYVRHMMRKSGCQPQDVGQDQPQSLRQQPPPPLAGSGGNPTLAQTLGPAPGLVTEAVWRFAEELELGESGADLLGRLPDDLQASVLRGFDPSGTKDGNVFGRLLGYVRSLWARRLGLSEPMSGFVRGLPEDVQIAVIANFDASGSKDGNVSARLLQFVNVLRSRGGGTLTTHQAGSQQHSRPPGSGPPRSSSPSGAASGSKPPRSRRPGSRGVQSSKAMADFTKTLGLDPEAIRFLLSLPEEIQNTVVKQFDPSGTKDGNIWGRLFAFVRRLSLKQAGVNQIHIDRVKSLPEGEQKRIILEWMWQDQYTKGGRQDMTQQHQNGFQPHPRQLRLFTTDSAVRNFSRVWGLDSRAESFVHSLPDPIRQQVLTGFDCRASKDGNVWGRLLGFARHTWARTLGLDSASVAFIKGLPEEAQMICLTDFDPSGTKDGNIALRLQGFAKKAQALAGHI